MQSFQKIEINSKWLKKIKKWSKIINNDQIKIKNDWNKSTWLIKIKYDWKPLVFLVESKSVSFWAKTETAATMKIVNRSWHI